MDKRSGVEADYGALTPIYCTNLRDATFAEHAAPYAASVTLGSGEVGPQVRSTRTTLHTGGRPPGPVDERRT